MMVSVSGALLERSIVDRMVGSPERLVFEGPPILVPPLAQDQESRRPIVHDGEFVDTVAACPPLTILQENTLEELKAQASLKLAPDITKARKKFIANQATKLVEQTSISINAAERVIERQCRGVLLPDVELVLVDGQTITVGDVLADPDRFEGYSLADPLEGIDYGRTTAKILLRADGTPWIRSFAHGLTNYTLKYDARAVRAAIESSDEKINVFVKHTLDAELDAVELKEITQEVAKTTKIGVRVIEAKLKSARLEQAKQHAEEQRERQIAERNDPRPRLMTQPEEKPWLPQIKSITEALKLTPRLQQTRRNIDGVTAYAHTQVIPNTYAFVSSTKNDDQND
jgi:hypothetical protein